MRIITGLTLCLLTGLATLAVPTFSATTMLEEIDVRATRQTPTQEELTVREVRESPARDMGEALQSIPGLDSIRKGAIANDVNLRGLQKDNINVFLDGVRLHGGCPSRMDPPSFHFDFAEVEQIQVIKGPYDLTNPGSMGGMINAISKQPPQGPAAKLNATYGTDELLNLSGTASVGSDQGDLLGGYAYKSSLSPKAGDGKRQVEVYTPGSPHSYRPEQLDSEAYKIHTAWLKGGYNLRQNVRSELGYSYQNAEEVFYPYLFMDAEYDRTHRVNWTLRADQLDAPVSALDLQLYWNQVEHLMHDEFRTSSLPSMMVTKSYSMQTDSQTSVYGAKATADWKLGSATLTTGADYYLRNWDAVNESAMYSMYAPQAMLPDVDVSNLGLFAEAVQPLSGSLELKGGVRLDQTTTEANTLDQTRITTYYQPYHPGTALDNRNDFTSASGNIQLGWQAHDGLQLFGGIGLGSRTPDPQELYIGLVRNTSMMMTNWIGNPDLDPSLNRQIDLGAKFSGDSYFLNISTFYSSIHDYITLTSVADPDGAGPLNKGKTYGNVDASLWGGEMNAQIALPHDFYLRGSLAYVRGENRDSDQPLAEIPPLNGTAGVRWDNDSFFLEVTERFADGQDRVDPDLQEEKTAGWAVTDIKAGANWGNWILTGGVNNLFDIYYVTHLSYQRDPFSSGVKVPETGALAYTTLSYAF